MLPSITNSLTKKNIQTRETIWLVISSGASIQCVWACVRHRRVRLLWPRRKLSSSVAESERKAPRVLRCVDRSSLSESSSADLIWAAARQLLSPPAESGFHPQSWSWCSLAPHTEEALLFHVCSHGGLFTWDLALQLPLYVYVSPHGGAKNHVYSFSSYLSSL